VAQKGAPAVEASRSYAGDVKQEGAPIEVKISLNVKEARGPLLVREPIPSNAEVEGASLDALMDGGNISGYEDENDSIVFYLAPDKTGTVEFSYRLDPVRRGTAIQPGTLVSTVADPDTFVSAQPTAFNVQ